MKKVGKKKLFFAIAGGILAVLLISFWILLIVITVNKVSAGSYEESPVRYIAHRGYSSKYYQNTVQSFAAAGEEDFFDGIETDVWLTKDNVFVCSHDVNPFVDKKVKITDRTYDEIKDLPLRISDETYEIDRTIEYRIATLEEYLNICMDTRKLAFIEMKQKFNEEETKALVDLAYGVLYRTRVYFCSFDKGVVDRVLEYKPLARTELFASVDIVAFAEAEMGYNVGLIVGLAERNDFYAKVVHKKGAFLGAWTVNDKKTAEKLVDNGVDWITTDMVLA